MSERTSRRTVVRSLGLATTAGLLAGCSTETRRTDDEGQAGGDGGGGGDGTDGGGGDGGGGDGGDGGGGDGGVPGEVDDYLSDAQEYDGDVVDATGEDNPTVAVGAGNGFAFDPAAVRVSQGTTVTWEWTGEGGAHNVVEQDEVFHSGDTVDEQGHTYEYTFDETGNFLYYCVPHEAAGMKGAVIVE